MSTLSLYVTVDLIAILLMFIAQKKNKAFVEKNGESPKKWTIINPAYIFLILSMIPLVLLIGFRDISVGIDTNSYYSAFVRTINNILTASDKIWLSSGFIILCRLVGFFSNKYIFLNLVIGFFSVLLIYDSIWKNSKNPTLSLFIWLSTCLYYQNFNQSRQMLAISIVFFSYKYILNNNLKMFLLCTLVSASIHSSALIMIPFYFLSNLNINKKNIFIYIVVAVLCILFFPLINKIILSTSYGGIYGLTGWYNAKESSGIVLIFRLLLLISCLFLSTKTINYYNSSDNKKLLNICIWCVILQIITTRIYIIGRITTYFYMAFILLIPNIHYHLKSKLKGIVFILIILLFSLYHFVYYKSVSVSSGYDDYSLYKEQYDY